MPIQSQEFLSAPPRPEEAAKCALFAEVISRHGKAKFKALGGSMIPSILPGDTLLVERQQISRLAPGDIAVYVRSGRLFAHRVTRILGQPGPALVTRGDAMACDDPPVLPEELLGWVVAVIPRSRAVYRLRRAVALLRNAVSSALRRRPLLLQP